MSSSQQPATGRHEGYALDVDRIVGAAPEALFDGFVAMYDTQRPEWVTDSQLDLRPGGRWSVAFQVPSGPAFREERVITAVERPRRLAYDMTAIYGGAATFSTTVEVTFETAPAGQRVRLVQRGFPSAAARDEFAAAWPDVLDELARRVCA